MEEEETKLIYHGFHMPNKWTFEIKPVKEYLQATTLFGYTLFPFAGKTRILDSPTHLHIDINPDMNPDILGDSRDVLKTFVEDYRRFNTIVLDPPFSFFQAVRTYGNKKMSDISYIKDLCNQLLLPRGKVISFGFNSTGMGKKRGYIKQELHIFNHGGNHNDMMMLVERKRLSLEEFF